MEKLIDLIRKNFVRKTDKPPLTSEGWVRSSGYSKLCVREELLCAKLKKDRVEIFDSEALANFAIGTGLHHAMQNVILPSIGGLLVGSWRCSKCGALRGPELGSLDFGAYIPCPETHHCDKDYRWVYEEQAFAKENDGPYQTRLTGHMDGFLRFEDPARPLTILELKSIGTNGWRYIQDRPNDEHRVQVHLYFLLTGLRDALIVYWNKGEKGTGGIKEHLVTCNQNLLFSVRDTLHQLWSNIDNPAPTIGKRVCETSYCRRALSCTVAKECWAGTEADGNNDFYLR